MVSNQTSKKVVTCRCFFLPWKQLRAVETHQKLFDTKDPGWKGAIEDTKKLMRKFNNFSLFYELFTFVIPASRRVCTPKE